MEALVNDIISYEQGDLSAEDTLSLFSKLIESGMAWRLQGSYARFAEQLIREGWIGRDGYVLRHADA